jgi:hypothetical protein
MLGTIDLVRVEARQVVRDVTVACGDSGHAEAVVRAVCELEGVRVDSVSDRTFLMRKGGKTSRSHAEGATNAGSRPIDGARARARGRRRRQARFRQPRAHRRRPDDDHATAARHAARPRAPISLAHRRQSPAQGTAPVSAPATGKALSHRRRTDRTGDDRGPLRDPDQGHRPGVERPKEPWAGALAGRVIPPGDPDNPLKARCMGFYDGEGTTALLTSPHSAGPPRTAASACPFPTSSSSSGAFPSTRRCSSSELTGGPCPGRTARRNPESSSSNDRQTVYGRTPTMAPKRGFCSWCSAVGARVVGAG